MSRTEDTRAVPLIASIIGAGFALIGVLPMPYPFYNLMRVVIAVACATLCVVAVNRRRALACAPLIILALLFLFVKGLPKETWAVIDFFTAVALVSAGVWLSRVTMSAEGGS